jgi:hypothetical protein
MEHTYEIHYTEQYVTRVVATSPEEALSIFQNGEFEPGKFVDGTTEVVGEVEGPVQD